MDANGVAMMHARPVFLPRRLRPVLSEKERKARLAYAIRTAREARGLTPPQLAQRMGRQRGTVNKWESGASAPSLLDLGPLCEALAVDARLFADLPAIPPPSPVLEYLVAEEVLAEAAESGVREGVRRASRPAPSDPGTPAPSRRRQPHGNGAGRE